MKLKHSKEPAAFLAIVLLALSLAVFTTCASGGTSAQTPASGGPADISNLLSWLSANPDAWHSGQGWSADPNDAPTDQELEAMLKMAVTPGTYGGTEDFHFVVVRDYEAQQKIMGAANARGTGEGMVIVLVFADMARDKDHHAEPYEGMYGQNLYGIFDAGTAMGYLQLAAISLGYATHPYAMMDLGINGAASGYVGARDFAAVQADYYNTSYFLTSKDGTTAFTHTLARPAKDIPAEGNLTLLCALAIGKPAVDATTKATSNARHDNFDFWDPQN
jgi:hypothetical protein